MGFFLEHNVSLSSKALLISYVLLMQSLRIHFSTSLGVSLKRLSDMFETAFKELNEMSHGVTFSGLKEPIFNLVPVLGAGNTSASLDNIITCELCSLRS